MNLRHLLTFWTPSNRCPKAPSLKSHGKNGEVRGAGTVPLWLMGFPVSSPVLLWHLLSSCQVLRALGKSPPDSCEFQLLNNTWLRFPFSFSPAQLVHSQRHCYSLVLSARLGSSCSPGTGCRCVPMEQFISTSVGTASHPWLGWQKILYLNSVWRAAMFSWSGAVAETLSKRKSLISCLKV